MSLPGDEAPARAGRLRTGSALLWLLPPLVALAAYRTVGGFEFVADCEFLIRDNLFLRSLDQLWANLTHDYFWSSSGNWIPYWRPLTKASWLLEYQLFGVAPGGYHLVQLGWHALAAAGVMFVARAVLRLGREAGAVAGLLFALHPVAAEPVCLVMARSDVVCVASLLWAVACWGRWWSTGSLGWLAAHALFAALALGSKESAVIVVPLLVVLGLALPADERGRSRLAKVLIGVLPAVALVSAYMVARQAVVGSGGLRVALEPARWVAGLAFYLPSLLPLRLDSAVRFVSTAEATSGRSLALAASSLLAISLLGWLAARRRAWPALALLAWVGLALGPVVLVTAIHVPYAVQNYPMANRWAYHAVAPAVLLAGWLYALAPARGLTRCALRLGIGAWVALAVVLAPSSHRLYSSPLAL
ncbi:MAG: glycosyltransferase family 39 protein, partial [Planctomycetota bacterium]